MTLTRNTRPAPKTTPLTARNAALAGALLSALALAACQTTGDAKASFESKSKEVGADLEKALTSIAEAPNQIFRSFSFARNEFITAVRKGEYAKADGVLGSDRKYFQVFDAELEKPIDRLVAHLSQQAELTDIRNRLLELNPDRLDEWTQFPELQTKRRAAIEWIHNTSAYALFPGKFHQLTSLEDAGKAAEEKFRAARKTAFAKYSLLEEKPFPKVYPGIATADEKKAFFRENLTEEKIASDLTGESAKSWRRVWQRFNEPGYLRSHDSAFFWRRIVEIGTAEFHGAADKHLALRRLVRHAVDSRDLAQVEIADPDIRKLLPELPEATAYDWIDLLKAVAESGRFAEARRVLVRKTREDAIPKELETVFASNSFGRLIDKIAAVPGSDLEGALAPELVLERFRGLSLEQKHFAILSTWKNLDAALKTALEQDYEASFYRRNGGIVDMEKFIDVAVQAKAVPFPLDLKKIADPGKLEGDLQKRPFAEIGRFLQADRSHNVLEPKRKRDIVKRRMHDRIAREFTSEESCTETMNKIRTVFAPLREGPVDVDALLRDRVALFLRKPGGAKFDIGFSAKDWTVRQVGEFESKAMSEFLAICAVDIRRATLDTKVLSESSLASERVVGHKSNPNPNYQQAQQEYQNSVLTLQRAEMNAQSIRNQKTHCGNNVWGCVLAGVARAAAAAAAVSGPRAQLKEAQERLSGIPMFLEEEIREPYRYKKSSVALKKEVETALYKVSYPKRNFVGFETKTTYDRNFDVVADVDSRDPNYGNLTAGADAAEAVRNWGRQNVDLDLASLDSRRPEKPMRGPLAQAPFLQGGKAPGKMLLTAVARTASAPTRSRFPTSPIALTYPRSAAGPHDVAVIIGNANYQGNGRDIPDVVPAYADAEGFRQLALEGLGIRGDNIIFLRDATQADMVATFGGETDHRGKLYNIVEPGKSKIFVFYSGHGAPGEKGERYLVPVDAQGTTIRLNGYPLATFYRNLGKLPARDILVVLDACFSGVSPGGTVVPAASGINLSAKQNTVPRNITVFAAGAADQIASWDKDKSHGLFTKYFLKGMSGEADAAPNGDGDGNIELGELKNYLKGTVTRLARRYYGRNQVVQVISAK